MSGDDTLGYTGLYCAVLLQALEDAFTPERRCTKKTASASATRIIKDQARNYFLSPSSDVKEARETLVRDLCGFPDPEKKIEVVQNLLLENIDWKQAKKLLESTFNSRKKKRK